MKKQTVLLFTHNCHDRFQLGNKGANLVTMTDLGVPVPLGFTISIKAFHDYSKSGVLPIDQIRSSIHWLEERTKTKFGDDLQVSVRSSGPVSMPGMMDTVLNVSEESALLESVARVFDSWNSPRAVEYRRLHDIPGDLGTAVIVQAIVFGSLDKGSGTGVLFTRNPNTGDNTLFGEYLAGAQGEDIVAGTSTPNELSALDEELPEVYRELHQWVKELERHYGDMQDVEFTVENNQLFILQTRTGKRTGQAAIRIVVEMVDEGLITKSDALLRISTEVSKPRSTTEWRRATERSHLLPDSPPLPVPPLGRLYSLPKTPSRWRSSRQSS